MHDVYRSSDNSMKSRTLIVSYILAVLTFFIGDLATTYNALSMGHQESNLILNYVGFGGTVLAKILFFILAYFVVTDIEKKGYESAGSFALGCVFMVGLLTVIINSGVFYR